MKLKIIPFFLLFICFFPAEKTTAQIIYNQNLMKKEYKQSITIHPFYTCTQGLRIDYDRQLKGRHWIQAAMIGYFSNSDEDFFADWMMELHSWRSLDKMNKAVGAGFEANYKYFPFPSIDKFFLTLGLSYTHFNIQYQKMGFHKFKEEGLTYYEYGLKDIEAQINRLGTTACFFLQGPPNSKFYVDVYAGVGYKYSFYDDERLNPSRNMNHLSYRGFHLTFGSRMGIRF